MKQWPLHNLIPKKGFKYSWVLREARRYSLGILQGFGLPVGRRYPDRANTHWRNVISSLAGEGLQISQVELESAAVERDIWNILLPSGTDTQQLVGVNKWSLALRVSIELSGHLIPEADQVTISVMDRWLCLSLELLKQSDRNKIKQNKNNILVLTWNWLPGDLTSSNKVTQSPGF